MRLSSNWILIVILFIGISVRIFSVYPNNTILGFDQARDLFDSTTIFKDFNLKIIGPTAGNNPNLHHGVLYLYYILPPLLFFHGNPMAVVYWNIIFNSLSILVLFLLSKNLFKSNSAALVTALIAAFSFEFTQYSGWLSNPTPTLLTVPLFFLGLSYCFLKKRWGLILAAFALGLSIQFELFFIYLIPITFLIFVLLKLPLPNIKTSLVSLLVLILTLSTMILTEIKFNFAGALSLISAGSKVGGLERDNTLTLFLNRFSETFSLNLWPSNLSAGVLLAIFIIGILLFSIKSRDQKGIIFALIYLFSPMIMLVLGYHNAPWFLIGLPPAIALVSGFVISRIKPAWLILPMVLAVAWANLSMVISSQGQGQKLLGPDPSALLADQLKAIDYTYQNSNGEKFTINSLTNPLYINAVWAYHYSIYGKQRYGSLPNFSGGDQLYPYNTLPKTNEDEKYLYLIIDQTIRIPVSHKYSLIDWADQRSRLLEEATFGGTLVQKRAVIY